MKKNKPWRTLLYILLLAALFILLVNPQLLFFLSPAMQKQLTTAVQSTFGVFRADGAMFTLPKLLNMIAVIVLVLLCSSVLRFIIDRITIGGKRSKTVAALVLSAIKYAGVIIMVVWCLSILGVNVTAIFASIGILGLVIGFGAQSLIEDIITGVFIIFEGQYNVGDIIILGDFRGTVQRIGVRTTCIQDAGGNVKIVNNSDIRDVQNRSENPSYAVCDVGVSYGVRVEDVEKVLTENLPRIGAQYPDLFMETPYYAGVQSLGDSAVVLRVLALVKEENIFGAQRKLNREIKVLFDDHGIEIPFTQIVLHNAFQAEKK